ncbi:MAG: 50S ribosomal protein L9 [Candidatus Pelagibacter sp.]|mgnify:CR=1 FL=1|tara:strand:- start:4234 stop:4689 length:456 start_codon:yes stop_codon:yes gene_type:complete
MKVILLENLRKIGSIGDIIDVKRGYARNYLISKKKALFASKTNIDEVKKIKNDLNKKDLDKKKEAKIIFDQINNIEYLVEKLCTETKELYGSVKPTEISKIIKEKSGIDIHTSLIQPVKEIKSIGTFKVLVNLHSEVQSTINIKVIQEETK